MNPTHAKQVSKKQGPGLRHGALGNLPQLPEDIWELQPHAEGSLKPRRWHIDSAYALNSEGAERDSWDPALSILHVIVPIQVA